MPKSQSLHIYKDSGKRTNCKSFYSCCLASWSAFWWVDLLNGDKSSHSKSALTAHFLYKTPRFTSPSVRSAYLNNAFLTGCQNMPNQSQNFLCSDLITSHKWDCQRKSYANAFYNHYHSAVVLLNTSGFRSQTKHLDRALFYKQNNGNS